MRTRTPVRTGLTNRTRFEAVIDGHPEPLPEQGALAEEMGQEGEQEESVGHGAAERAFRGLLAVDVDPLAVLRAFGERVDPFLGHGEPVGDADLLSDEALELSGCQLVPGHGPDISGIGPQVKPDGARRRIAVFPNPPASRVY